MEQLKLKLLDVIDIRKNSAKLFDCESMPIGLAFKLSQFQKQIWELSDDYAKKRDAALALCGKPADNRPGAYVLDSEGQEKFNKMVEELDNVEVEVDFYQFALADFGNSVGIPASAIRPLLKHSIIKE